MGNVGAGGEQEMAVGLSAGSSPPHLMWLTAYHPELWRMLSPGEDLSVHTMQTCPVGPSV